MSYSMEVGDLYFCPIRDTFYEIVKIADYSIRVKIFYSDHYSSLQDAILSYSKEGFDEYILRHKETLRIDSKIFKLLYK